MDAFQKREQWWTAVFPDGRSTPAVLYLVFPDDYWPTEFLCSTVGPSEQREPIPCNEMGKVEQNRQLSYFALSLSKRDPSLGFRSSLELARRAREPWRRVISAEHIYKVINVSLGSDQLLRIAHETTWRASSAGSSAGPTSRIVV